MRTGLLFLLTLVTGLGVSGQRRPPSFINAETPEGKAVQSIAQESDETKKLGLMTQFVAEFPKHEAAGWVLSQAQALYVKTGQFDKAIAAGDTLLAEDPADLEAAYQSLKASEAKKDADGVIKWSAKTSEVAKKVSAGPKPEDAEQAETWKQSVDYAKQVDTYTEYALYAQALQATDPAKAMMLVEALEQRNPQSQYLPQVMSKYASAARQANATDKAFALGERAFGRNQFNEDLLLVMADASMQQKQHDKTALYGAKAAEIMKTKTKPEGVADADWENRKNVVTGFGLWMAGLARSDQNQYAEADQLLRAALPLIKDNKDMLPRTLFHLGLVNYKRGQASKNKVQIADAVRFSEQCAAIPGPFQAQARKNVKVIKTEFKLP